MSGCQFGIKVDGQCQCINSCYSGRNCELFNCYNGGKQVGKFGCLCSYLWEGVCCNTPRCLNGGIWKEGRCLCGIRHSGFHCEIPLCEHNGTDRGDGYCYCPEPYSGGYCELTGINGTVLMPFWTLILIATLATFVFALLCVLFWLICRKRPETKKLPPKPATNNLGKGNANFAVYVPVSKIHEVPKQTRQGGSTVAGLSYQPLMQKPLLETDSVLNRL